MTSGVAGVAGAIVVALLLVSGVRVETSTIAPGGDAFASAAGGEALAMAAYVNADALAEFLLQGEMRDQ